MTDIKNIENIYFVGIGGIGMSALARYFNRAGVKVFGYDKTTTELTRLLQAEGMDIVYDETADLPQVFQSYSAKNAVIYTPAIPAENKILQQLQQHYQPLKRAQALGLISKSLPTLAVAGTHGKTTTSILLAHLLQSAKVPLVAFLGGIAKKFDSNVITSSNPEYMVVEADEFDRSFLTLYPEIAAITSVDADHLDIYESRENIAGAYVQFSRQVKHIITKPQIKEMLHHNRVNTYAVKQPADAQLLQYKVDNHRVMATFKIEDRQFEAQLNFPGLHNAENTLAAAYIAYKVGVAIPDIIRGIETFEGVKRRFEFHIKQPGLVFIDDYAHHPAEISATLNAVKQLYPEKKLTVIFQPHLYSRTRDFDKEFAQALDIADQIALLPIYPARELPIQGVSSASILRYLPEQKSVLIEKAGIPAFIQKHQPDLLVTMGAGDIDKELPQIKNVLLKQMQVNE